MTYAQNDTDAIKNYYEVHIRSTKTFEDPTRVYQLMALANDLSSFTDIPISGTGVDQGDEVDTSNAIYDCCANPLSNVIIDLASETIAGEVAGDILIFRFFSTDTTENVQVTDENAVTITMDNVNDVIVFVYTTKWEYWFMAADGDTANQEDYFTEIGVLDEGPSITTEKGDSKTTNKGNEVFTKKINFETNDLQVNEANSDFYRSIAAAGNVDIMFYEPTNTDHSYFFLNFPLENYLNIKGNSWNTISLMGMKETSLSNMGDYLKLFADQTV